MSDNQVPMKNLHSVINDIKKFDRNKKLPYYELCIGDDSEYYNLDAMTDLYGTIEKIYENLQEYKDMEIILYYIEPLNSTVVSVIQEGAD